jgi:lipid-binding SYLF domain-containing protein
MATGKYTLGGDASVAAGPAGRQSTASTDLKLRAEIYSYSRSRGAFLGLSLEGSALLVDHRSNAGYYGKPVNPAELLTGAGLQIHESALGLRTVLTNMTTPPRVIVPAPVPVPTLPPPGPVSRASG